LIVATKLASFS